MPRLTAGTHRYAIANTGTTLRFWPDPKFFDSDKISVSDLKHVLRAKAVLCPGLRIRFEVEKPEGGLESMYELVAGERRDAHLESQSARESDDRLRADEVPPRQRQFAAGDPEGDGDQHIAAQLVRHLEREVESPTRQDVDADRQRVWRERLLDPAAAPTLAT